MYLPPMNKHEDLTIEMVPCKNQTEVHVNSHEDSSAGVVANEVKNVSHPWDNSATKFCPKYNGTELFGGSYYSEKYSWLRLGVHRCDPTEIVTINGKN